MDELLNSDKEEVSSFDAIVSSELSDLEIYSSHNPEFSSVSSRCMSPEMEITEDKSMNICEKCGKSFSRKSGLIRHCIIHMPQKPFICSYKCGKSFSTY